MLTIYIDMIVRDMLSIRCTICNNDKYADIFIGKLHLTF